MEFEYAWKKGSVGHVPADVAFAQLDRLRRKNHGDLTAELIVEDARPHDAVLHPQIFDRPQKAAAEEYYKQRARQTMQGLVVLRETEDSTPENLKVLEVRAFVTVEEKVGDSGRMTQIYSLTEEALQNPIRREFILAEAIRQVAVWRKRYAALSELAKVFRAIDELAV
jgi:hypothetical protein